MDQELTETLHADTRLSPELQILLRNMHQESCQLLSLSQTLLLPSVTNSMASNRVKHLQRPAALSPAEPISTKDFSTLSPLVTAEKGRTDLIRLHQTNQAEEELRKELHKLRLQLKAVEGEHQEQHKALQREQSRLQELQEQLHRERELHASRQRQERSKCKELYQSLGARYADTCHLHGALERERATISNLQAELKIERSRCQALLTHQAKQTKDAMKQWQEAQKLTHKLERERKRDWRVIHQLWAQLERHRGCRWDPELGNWLQLQASTARLQESLDRVSHRQVGSNEPDYWQSLLGTLDDLQKDMDRLCSQKVLLSEQSSWPTWNQVRRVQERYLRVENRRKALVYQKKYLLLLLGASQNKWHIIKKLNSCPLSRFKIVVWVVVAIQRLRFLANKWKKAKKKGPVFKFLL